MNIVLLMAGDSHAFDQASKAAGISFPKSLVEVGGVPLIQKVIENITAGLKPEDRLICCIREDENKAFHVGMVIKHLVPNAVIVEVRNQTQGAACTALLAVDHINNDQPLVVVNGDQVLEVNLRKILDDFERKSWDGGIIVFKAVHPRWSFVRCDKEGFVVEAAEKRPISQLATAGIYYFKKGADFIAAAVSMIKKDAHEDGLFYVCPAYNEMVLKQAKIGVQEIDRNLYFSLKTPQGVEKYEEYLKATGLRKS